MSRAMKQRNDDINGNLSSVSYISDYSYELVISENLIKNI